MIQALSTLIPVAWVLLGDVVVRGALVLGLTAAEPAPAYARASRGAEVR